MLQLCVSCCVGHLQNWHHDSRRLPKRWERVCLGHVKGVTPAILSLQQSVMPCGVAALIAIPSVMSVSPGAFSVTPRHATALLERAAGYQNSTSSTRCQLQEGIRGAELEMKEDGLFGKGLKKKIATLEEKGASESEHPCGVVFGSFLLRTRDCSHPSCGHLDIAAVWLAVWPSLTLTRAPLYSSWPFVMGKVA